MIFFKTVAYDRGMKTVFLFLKKTALFLCIAFIVFSCALSASVAFSEVRVFHRSFHFVVIVTEKTEVSAGLSELDGGAGYVMKGGDSVALGVYFSLSQAEKVKEEVGNRYEVVEIVSFSTEKFRFKSKREKQNADKILAAFSTLYEYLHLIYDESVRLETGGTQENGKRILSAASRQLSYLGEENEKADGQFANVCSAASVELLEIVSGIVYAKELRAFLCKYAEEYLTLADRYRL